MVLSKRMSGKRAKQIRRGAGRFANDLTVEAFGKDGPFEDMVRVASGHYYGYIRAAKRILRSRLSKKERKAFWRSVNKVTLTTRENW